MPIKIPDQLPAKKTLQNENIFIMDASRAFRQDIRPLKIAILNLMPLKISTETQLLRMLGNTPLQLEVTLLHPQTHQSKHTPVEHLSAFYKTFDEIRHQKFDGMIITGAPIEHLEYEEITYWDELKEVFAWTKESVTSTIHICWGAQAALYYHYQIPKIRIPKKLFGLYAHTICKKHIKLLRGFDDCFYAPHSRYTDISAEDVEQVEELEILSTSEEAGIYLLGRKDGSQIFVSGHSEYDRFTLKNEYERDLKRGIDQSLPVNYFPNDDPSQPPVQIWRAHANLLFSNWLNYYVYQETPYDLS